MRTVKISLVSTLVIIGIIARITFGIVNYLNLEEAL